MKIGFIGAGKMAEAMIAAFIKSDLCAPNQVFASDVSADRRKALKVQYGINTYSSNKSVAGLATTLFLAVKPQDLDAALEEAAPAIGAQHLVISIAAGKRLAHLESKLPAARLIRVMPNLACAVAQSMSVFTLGTRATPRDRAEAQKLLASFGKVLELPEDQFDAVTALSGSGPAFLAYFMNLMVDAAVAEGLSRETALVLAEQTMLGTATVLMQLQQDPREFVAAVSSAKGTTAEGIQVLDASAIADIVQRMIAAATRRSRELSR